MHACVLRHCACCVQRAFPFAEVRLLQLEVASHTTSQPHISVDSVLDLLIFKIGTIIPAGGAVKGVRGTGCAHQEPPRHVTGSHQNARGSARCRGRCRSAKRLCTGLTWARDRCQQPHVFPPGMYPVVPRWFRGVSFVKRASRTMRFRWHGPSDSASALCVRGNDWVPRS